MDRDKEKFLLFGKRYTNGDGKLPTGIKELDDLMSAGIKKGESSTLIGKRNE